MSGVGGPDPTPFYCTAFLLSHDVFEEWSAGGLDGKKNTLGDHEWGLFAVLDDGSGVEFSYKKLKWPGS